MSAQAVVTGRDPADDVALVARVAAGDAAALKGLYDRHAARVLGVAERVLGVMSESEEVVQETFVQIWKTARDYDPARAAPVVWMATIARSRAIDRVRARGAAGRKLAAIASEPLVARSRSPLEDAEARVQREAVGAAMATLPAEQRQTLELAFFEGLTHKEISERTNQPLGTVKTRVRLGMEKLEALLRDVRP